MRMQIQVLLDCEIDDPSRVEMRQFDTHAKDRQDVIKADCSLGQEAHFVSLVVRRLFQASRRTRPVAGVRQRATLRHSSQKRRGHRRRIWYESANAPTVPRIDQVGRRKTTRSMPANRCRRACPSRGHCLHRRIRHDQERQRDRRCWPAMERQSWKE